MNTKDLLILAGIITVGYVGYQALLVKGVYISQIVNTGNYGIGKTTEEAKTGLKNLEKGFLKAWANAAKKEESQFIYQSKVFVTKGGRAKK